MLVLNCHVFRILLFFACTEFLRKKVKHFIPIKYKMCYDSWLVVVSPHPLEAIETQDPVALSMFIFSSLYLTPVNNG